MASKEIHAVMLAAGTGRRLNNSDNKGQPKCLLEFDGKSLLRRHIEALTSSSVESLTIVVGFKSEEILSEIDKIGANDFVNYVYNDRFEKGSVISLWCASEKLRSGHPILLMDADVLYHPSLIRKLTTTTNQSILPYDLEFEVGDEPVKVCLKNNKPVEFGKSISCHYDEIGEWPGFIRLSPRAADLIADNLENKILEQDFDSSCEVAIREVILEAPQEEFSVLEISGIPWIEIDFLEDLLTATSTTLPAINSFSG